MRGKDRDLQNKPWYVSPNSLDILVIDSLYQFTYTDKLTNESGTNLNEVLQRQIPLFMNWWFIYEQSNVKSYPYTLNQ